MPDLYKLLGYEIFDYQENDDDILANARTISPHRCCPECQSLNFKKHGVREALYMDTPSQGKRVGIRVYRQRYRCKACKAIFIDRLIAMDENHMMTDRLVRYIKTECFEQTFVKLAKTVGVTEGAIRAVFKAYIQDLEASRKIDTPKWLGIDEIHLLNSPRCVITDVQNRTLVDMLKNRNKPLVEYYLQRLTDRKSIQIVTMDMWRPYFDAVQATIPQAKCVVDRFHVVKMANSALNEIRKDFKFSLSVKERRRLMHDRFILLSRFKDLEAKDRLILDSWILNIPKLGKAYSLKEALFDLYDLTDRKEAEEQYQKWLSLVVADGDLAPYFEDLTKAVSNWHDPIFNFFEYRITNGYTESINSIIKLANRIGRGYSFEVIRAKMIYRTKGQKPTFRGGSLKVYQQGQTPDEVTSSSSCGVPLDTLIELLEQGKL